MQIFVCTFKLLHVSIYDYMCTILYQVVALCSHTTPAQSRETKAGDLFGQCIASVMNEMQRKLELQQLLSAFINPYMIFF